MVQHFHVPLALLMLASLVAVAPPTVSASSGAPSPDCELYAYTVDPSLPIYTLILSNSSIIGNDFVIHSDCGSFMVYIDGVLIGGAERTFSSSLDNTIDTLSIQFDNATITYSNLTVYPAGTPIGEQPSIEDPITISSSSYYWNEIIANIITIVIIYFLTTTVVAALAVYRTDREIEPVI